MAKTTDWFPNSREGQLAMVKDWQSVAGANADAWGIPASAMTGFGIHIRTEEDALETAKNETTRTPADTARCKEAFDALTAFMRDFKRRYFLSPPLTDADFVSLGLKPYDTTHTASGTPPSQAQLIFWNLMAGVLLRKTPKLSGDSRIARHELGVKIVYVTGSADGPANKGLPDLVQRGGGRNSAGQPR